MEPPSRVVTMPTRSGWTAYTWSCSGDMPWAAAEEAVITSKAAVLMR
jgi:hypothetical protein